MTVLLKMFYIVQMIYNVPCTTKCPNKVLGIRYQPTADLLDTEV